MSSPKSNGTLGIMVCANHSGRYPPFTDRGFYKRLSKIGSRAGIEVIIFDPIMTDWKGKNIVGYRFNTTRNRWHKVVRPVPAVIYDRCFYNGKSQFLRYRDAANRLKNIRTVHFLAKGLSGKWQVQQILLRNAELEPYLPETHQLSDTRQVTDWLAFERACILKPNAGSHGKRIVRITRLDAGGFEVNGRDSRNQPVHSAFDSAVQMRRWLQRFMGSKKFLLQESLALHTDSGQSFDVRALVQKDGSGIWSLTGMAVRVGRPGSLTANLHGGGSTCPLPTFLARHYDAEQAESITGQLEHLSRLIPHELEQQFGRLVELGIDYGIDGNGKVWILEVNSKPGRAIFAKLHDARKSTVSVSNLIQYARYLLDRHLGGLSK